MVAIARPAVSVHARHPRVFTRDQLRGDMVLGCDVVIIGSGAGGATAAAELAEAGFDVIVVEEGRYFTTRDFTANASSMIRAMYRDGAATVAMGSPPILYQEGSVVGGSTVINGAMSWRTPEKILNRWASDDGLTGHTMRFMEPYFERVERRIHVRGQDPESLGRDNELLRIGAERKGWKVIPNLRNQVHCAGSNNCAFGCPTGAKQSALVTYIPRALHFGARIYSDLRVSKILFHGKRAVGVRAQVLENDATLGATVTVHAKVVITSAGAIQTPALLTRSGVRSPSKLIGENLSLHPNVKVEAIFDESVRGWEGVHQAYQVREFEEEGYLFAAVNVPPSVVAMTSHNYGAALGTLLSAYERTVIAGLLLEDTSVGRVRTLPGGNPLAFYDLSDFDADRLKRGVALLSELLFEAGAKSITLPFVGAGDLNGPDDIKKIFANKIAKKTMEVVTVHMMGTARMGSDPTRAVTNQFGAVYDADRLFVCDASLFPGPIGVNPAETIQALSTRNAHHIIENRRKYLS